MTKIKFAMRHILALFVAIVVAALPIYWATDREPPVVRAAGFVIPSDAAPGQHVETRFVIVKLRQDCSLTIQREFVDACGIIHRQVPFDAGYQNTPAPFVGARELMIPRGMCRGPAMFTSTVFGICNPIHNWWPVIQSEPPVHFNVIDR